MNRVAKLMRAVLAGVLLLVIPTSVQAITDIGRPEITRLYDADGEMMCTASYIFPYISDSVSWIVTAAHCAEAHEARRNTATTGVGIVNWRGVLLDYNSYTNQVQDIALGTVPDVRKGDGGKLWLANEDLTGGETVYIHGFPDGIERVSRGYALPPEVVAQISLKIPAEWGGEEVKKLSELKTGTTKFLAVKHGEVLGGSSGCPILNEHDQVEGILWGTIQADTIVSGVIDEGYDLVMYTPISRLHKLMEFLGVK